MLPSPGRSIAVVLAAAAAAMTVSVGSPVSAGSPSTGRAAEDPTAARAVVHTGTTSTRQPNAVAGSTAAGAVPPVEEVTQSLTDGMPGDRPNILVIMTDDMRADELQFMPNVRRLIEDRGVNFVNSFSPNPLCCPARASFVTGQYTHNHKVWSNNAPYGFPALDDSSTIATDLSAAGYQTAMLGKYLNGYGTGSPYGRTSGNSYHYIPPGWQDWRGSVNRIFMPGTPEAGGTYSYFDTTLNVNGTLVGNPLKYQTRMFGDETEDMLDGLTRSPKPFFLWVSFVAPHAGGPIEPDDPGPVLRDNGDYAHPITPARPADVKGMFDSRIRRSLGAVPEPDLSDKPEYLKHNPTLNDAEVAALTKVSRERAESLFVVDQQVARIIDVLEREGELDNTILFFTSDNGYLLGEHGQFESKRLPYESALRVPTLMAGPGIPHGVKRHDPFMTPDFAPTFLSIAGARTSRPIDGVSLYDVARHGDHGWTRPVFTETGPRRLRHYEPKLEIYPEGPSSLRFSQGLRTERYLYMEHATGERELYDLRTDPLELDSISGDPRMAGVMHDLAKVLDEMRMCRGRSCDVSLPAYLQGR